jgi:L-fuconolactonase
MMNRRSFIAKSIASSLAGRVDASFPSSITDKRSLLIDSHVHVWKHDPAFPFAQGAHPPAEDASVETLLELMEGNAVDRTVLIQVIHYRWDNSYLADVLKRHPGRLKAVCRVNPEDPKAPDQLSRLTEEHGFHGVRISPGAGEAIDQPCVLSKDLRQNLSYVVDLETAISLSRYKRADQTPLQELRSQTPYVGN